MEGFRLLRAEADPEALQFIRTRMTLIAKSNASLCTITKATIR
ncbi:hypothetical protein FHT70_002743 [Rhizobium sp. BK049]|nr:hypothetical protein [Rhizobium sp. BK049]